MASVSGSTAAARRASYSDMGVSVPMSPRASVSGGGGAAGAFSIDPAIYEAQKAFVLAEMSGAGERGFLDEDADDDDDDDDEAAGSDLDSEGHLSDEAFEEQDRRYEAEEAASPA